MEIKTVDIGKLKPFGGNPKKHPKNQIELLRKSLRTYGQTKSVIVDAKYMILAGHGLVEAAKKNGMTEIRVGIVPFTGKEALAYVLADNKIAELAEWDFTKLADVFEEIDDGSIDLELTGFGMDEIEDIMTWNTGEDKEDDFDPDKAAEKIKIPHTKLGDIYKLGRHWLMCGSATNKEHIDKLLVGRKLDMVFTDPPYNVNYEGTKHGKILGDNQTKEEFVEFSCEFLARMAEVLKPGGVYYICSGFSSYPIFVYGIKQTGMVFSTPIIWVKNNTSLGWGDYRHKHEMVLKGKTKKKPKAIPILYGWNKGRHYFIDTRFEADVWHIKRRASTTMAHPTQKPLALITRAVKNSSKQGELIGDFFGGSGVTLIVAEREGRICYIMDLDPVYCDVIIGRWEELTKDKAVKVE